MSFFEIFVFKIRNIGAYIVKLFVRKSFSWKSFKPKNERIQNICPKYVIKNMSSVLETF